MNKRCFFFLLPFICLSVCVKAQIDPTNYNRTDIIAQSPTAGSLERRQNLSINLSTGASSLSVPIFTVTGHELSLPISLNYGYNGFKPAMPISWVGLGWTLQAGGVITRTVHGAVDHTLATGRNFDDVAIDTVINNHNQPSLEFLTATSKLLYDTEPDVYNFNFAGHSGQFIYSKGQFTLMPYQKIKITGTDHTSFTITTEDGTKYFFNATETTSAKGSPNADYTVPAYTSAWYLSSIVNASGTDKITLEYTSDGEVSSEGVLTQTFKKNNTWGQFNSDQLLDARVTLPTYINTIRLTGIASEKYNVTFSPDTAVRKDIFQYPGVDARALAKITVRDNLNQKTVKYFRLNMGYFEGGAGYSNQHLKLKSVEDMPSPPLLGEAPDPTVKQKFWLFDYEDEYDSYPSSTFAWIDHYGYYTGNGSSTTLIPNTVYRDGIDRTPVFTGAKMGALKKVTYPTGGYSTFAYEPNTTYDGENYVSEPHTKNAVATGPATPHGSPIQSPHIIFNINKTQTATVTIQRDAVTHAFDSIVKHGEPDFKVFKGEGIDSNLFAPFYDEYIGNDSLSTQDFKFEVTPGKYLFYVQADDNESRIEGEFKYDSLTTIPIEGAPMGGIRVKQTVNNSLIGDSTITAYRYTDALGFSTGLSKFMGYGTTSFTEVEVPSIGLPVYKQFLIYTSSLSLREDAGTPFYYQSVYQDEKNGEGNTLTTRTEFSDYSDHGLDIVPRKVTVYKEAEEGKIPISITENNYKLKLGNWISSMRSQLNLQMIGGGFTYNGPNLGYEYSSILYEPGWLYLKSSRNVSYEGTDSLVTTTENTYDVSGTRNLKMVNTVSSGGETHITKYKYPEDYTSTLNSTFVAKNILSPVWETQSWEKEGTDSVLVGLGVTQYSNSLFLPVKQYALGTTPLSALDNETQVSGKFSALLSDSHLEDRVTFGYDSAARIISQQLTGGPPTAYKWGYTANSALLETRGQKNYPIAEVKNALPTEFYFENFEEVSGADTTGGAHTGIKYKSGDFTLSWTPPGGKAYMMSYWYRDSGIWKYYQAPYASGTFSLGDAIDDVRVYPADAVMSTYTYFPGIGISSATDPKGLVSKYEYDRFSGLKYIKDHNGDIVKSVAYNYDSKLKFNETQSRDFAKNDCTGEGFIGGTITTYTVPAGTYGAITTEEANAQAMEEIDANGQNYANEHGVCLSYAVISADISVSPNKSFELTLHNVDTGEDDTATLSNGHWLGPEVFVGTYTVTVHAVSSLSHYTVTFAGVAKSITSGSTATWTSVYLADLIDLIIR